jgi:hypothetical protein
MFATLLAGALLSLTAHPDPCAQALPRGPAVPAPIVLSTDCGWFRLETDGAVSRLPVDWLATQNAAWRRKHGNGLTIRRTRSGRYLVARSGRVIWRSAGAYYNDYVGIAFGSNAFAFGSYRRGLFLTDLRSPERLVVPARNVAPLGFTAQGELLAAGRGAVFVVSPEGIPVRRYRYRQSSGYSFDEPTKTLYFVSSSGMLSAVRGSALRRISKANARGAIGLLGRRLLTFVARGHVVIVRRRDGSVVARASWRPRLGDLDAGVDVSDDGRLFAFRVTRARPGVRRSRALVFVLRAGERRARIVYRHRLARQGCGSGGGVDWGGSSLLYRSVDGTGVAETAILGSGGLVTRLTPLLRALPRLSPNTPGNALWAEEFSS